MQTIIRRVCAVAYIETLTVSSARTWAADNCASARYGANPLSLRHIEEMMAERDVSVDHATTHRRAVKIPPELAAAFRKRRRLAVSSWRMDETYILVG